MMIVGKEESERLVTVVEHVEAPMSEELLCKFPDYSAYDFDHAQSSIWSPLVPRAYTYAFPPFSSFGDGDGYDLGGGRRGRTGLTTQKRLSCGGLDRKATPRRNKLLNKFTASIKKNIITAFNISNKTSEFNSAATPIKATSSPANRKGWCKVLKAASKHFKKKKKKDPAATAHIKLYNYLKDGYF